MLAPQSATNAITTGGLVVNGGSVSLAASSQIADGAAGHADNAGAFNVNGRPKRGPASQHEHQRGDNPGRGQPHDFRPGQHEPGTTIITAGSIVAAASNGFNNPGAMTIGAAGRCRC